MELSLRASEDGTSLVVKKFTEEHNHVVSRVCAHHSFQYLRCMVMSHNCFVIDL